MEKTILEQRLQAFIESSSDAMLLLDEEGTIILSNHLMQHCTGYLPSELAGSHLDLLIPVLSGPSQNKRRVFHFSPHRMLAAEEDLKMFVQRKDGLEFPANIRFSSISIQDQVFLHVTIANLIDSYIVEEQANQLNRILLETQQIAKIGSWEWDPFTDELFYSDNFYNIIKRDRTSHNPSYTSFLELIHPEDREDVRDAFRQAVRGTGHYSAEYRFVLNDNSVIDVHDKGVVDYDSFGTPIRMLGFIQDITERRAIESSMKQYAAELKAARDTAEEAIATKSKFLAMMSHELRTPLNGVIGMASLLDGTGLDNEQKEYVKTISYSGDALLGIINDILDYAQIDAGSLAISLRPFEIRDCIYEVIDQFAELASRKGLELTGYVHKEVPGVILADERRVRQVLINMISNAVKFSKEGKVSVEVSLAERTSHGYKVHYAVRDTGIGIPEQQLSSLFELFTQLDSSSTRPFGGTGLGLTICKQLIHLMKGQIGVESEENKGTTFWFEVNSPDIDMKKTRVRFSGFRDKTLGCIIKDQGMLLLLGEWCRSTAVLLNQYQQVEELETSSHLDALLVDTEDDYIKTIEWLRDNSNPIPVVFIGSYEQEEERIRGMRLISRPLKYDTLFEELESALMA